MTKKEIETGDIIVNRAGFLGVVLKEKGTILFQTIGEMWLDELEEDLTCGELMDNNADYDIMEIFRGNTFLDVEIDEDMPEYQRDPNWRRPCRKDRIIKIKEMDKNCNRKKIPITMV